MIAGPAQRFSSFDLDSNMGLLDITKTKDTGVYNTVANQLKETSQDVKNFLNSATEGVMPDLSAVRNVRDNLVRQTRDVFSSIQDMTGFTAKQVTDEIASFIPNTDLRNAFQNLSSQCRKRATAQRPGFKKPKDKASCGKGNGACSSASVSGLLNKATGGLFAKAAQLFSDVLRSLTALATLGFDAGLCKVFGELIKGLDNNTVQKGAAFLLANQGLKGNTSAVLDIATNMGIGRTGVIPSLEVPGLVGMAVSNFTKPVGYSDKIATGWMEGYGMAMDEIQPDWNKSSEDGITSMAGVCTKKSAEFEDAMLSASANKDFGLDDVNEAVVDDTDAFTGAYSAWDGNDPNRTDNESSFFA